MSDNNICNDRDLEIMYLERVNQLNEEIKVIKSVECIMDYDTKTEIINKKKN